MKPIDMFIDESATKLLMGEIGKIFLVIKDKVRPAIKGEIEVGNRNYKIRCGEHTIDFISADGFMSALIKTQEAMNLNWFKVEENKK